MVVMCNATFNNSSATSWRAVLIVEETGELGENHRPATSHRRETFQHYTKTQIKVQEQLQMNMLSYLLSSALHTHDLLTNYGCWYPCICTNKVEYPLPQLPILRSKNIIYWRQLDLHLPCIYICSQVNASPVSGEVYSTYHFVIKFVSN